MNALKAGCDQSAHNPFKAAELDIRGNICQPSIGVRWPCVLSDHRARARKPWLPSSCPPTPRSVLRPVTGNGALPVERDQRIPCSTLRCGKPPHTGREKRSKRPAPPVTSTRPAAIRDAESTRVLRGNYRTEQRHLLAPGAPPDPGQGFDPQRRA